MMRVVILGFSALLGACAIHPTPDYNGADRTLFIAKRIRCEAREAVKARFVKEARRGGNIYTREIAENLESEPDKFRYKDFDRKKLDPETRKFLDRFEGAAVAYNFLFDITESGGAGASLTLVRPLSGGSLTSGIGAGAELKRQNQRAFLLNDTFAGLMTKLSKSDCIGLENGSQWLYPIKGGIGLGEMVDTFIDLDLTGSLAKGENAAPYMIDTIEFTTELTASAHPSLVLTSAGRRWQTTNITAPETGIHLGRVDKNKVEVSFSVAIPHVETISKFAKARGSTSGSSTPAEINAGRAIFNKNTLQFFNNSLELQRKFNLPNAQ